MSFLNVPVLFFPDDYDPERLEGVRVDVEMKEGTMDININMLCQFHGTDQGTTMLSLADGTIVESTLSYDNFRELLTKTEAIISVITQRIN
jgi:hypothetical protein